MNDRAKVVSGLVGRIYMAGGFSDFNKAKNAENELLALIQPERGSSVEFGVDETGMKRPLTPPQPEREPGEPVACHDCELPYDDDGFQDLVVPHDVWDKISHGDTGLLLCANCMNRRCVGLGVETDARWRSGPFFQDAPQPERDQEKVAKWLEQYRAKVMPRDMHPYQYGQHAKELLALIRPGEPVAWGAVNDEGEVIDSCLAKNEDVCRPVWENERGLTVVPLFLAPQPERGREALDRKVLTLCGSTRFREAYERYNEDLTLAGHVVISVGLFGHGRKTPLTPEQKQGLDALHFDKIRISDGIVVLDVDGYVGGSTHNEIVFAESLGKKVYRLNDGSVNAILGGEDG